jgi:hypothetical protein
VNLDKNKGIHSYSKIRKDLDEVILYEAIASRNDNYFKCSFMSEAGRISYFKNYIDTLKKKDEAKRIIREIKRKKSKI